VHRDPHHHGADDASATPVTASGTSVTETFGVGPVIAAMLTGNSASMSRLGNR